MNSALVSSTETLDHHPAASNCESDFRASPQTSQPLSEQAMKLKAFIEEDMMDHEKLKKLALSAGVSVADSDVTSITTSSTNSTLTNQSTSCAAVAEGHSTGTEGCAAPPIESPGNSSAISCGRPGLGGKNASWCRLRQGKTSSNSGPSSDSTTDGSPSSRTNSRRRLVRGGDDAGLEEPSTPSDSQRRPALPRSRSLDMVILPAEYSSTDAASPKGASSSPRTPTSESPNRMARSFHRSQSFSDNTADVSPLLHLSPMKRCGSGSVQHNYSSHFGNKSIFDNVFDTTSSPKTWLSPKRPSPLRRTASGSSSVSPSHHNGSADGGEITSSSLPPRSLSSSRSFSYSGGPPQYPRRRASMTATVDENKVYNDSSEDDRNDASDNDDDDDNIDIESEDSSSHSFHADDSFDAADSDDAHGAVLAAARPRAPPSRPMLRRSVSLRNPSPSFYRRGQQEGNRLGSIRGDDEKRVYESDALPEDEDGENISAARQDELPPAPILDSGGDSPRRGDMRRVQSFRFASQKVLSSEADASARSRRAIHNSSKEVNEVMAMQDSNHSRVTTNTEASTTVNYDGGDSGEKEELLEAKASTISTVSSSESMEQDPQQKDEAPSNSKSLEKGGRRLSLRLRMSRRGSLDANMISAVKTQQPLPQSQRHQQSNPMRPRRLSLSGLSGGRMGSKRNLVDAPASLDIEDGLENISNHSGGTAGSITTDLGGSSRKDFSKHLAPPEEEGKQEASVVVKPTMTRRLSLSRIISRKSSSEEPMSPRKKTSRRLSLASGLSSYSRGSDDLSGSLHDKTNAPRRGILRTASSTGCSAVTGLTSSTTTSSSSSNLVPSLLSWSGKGRRKVRFDMRSLQKHDPPTGHYTITAQTKTLLWYSKQDWQSRRMKDRTFAMEDSGVFSYLLHTQALVAQRERSNVGDSDIENSRVSRLIRNVTRGIAQGYRGLEVWNPMTGRHRRERIREVVVSIVACSQLWRDSADSLREHSLRLTQHCRVVARRMGHADALVAASAQKQESEQKPNA